jgi:putative methyltransferase
MGFFVVCFVRDGGAEAGGVGEDEDDGPFVRDERGRIVRDENGIPTLKSTGRKVVDLDELAEEEDGIVEVRFGGEEGSDGDGPFERDAEGRIVRGPDGMPRLKARAVSQEGDEEEEEDEEEESGGEEEGDEESDGEWGGFED